MASFVKINDFVEDLGNAVHNFDTAQLVVALTNTAPASEGSNPTADGNGVLANLTQITYTNLSARNVTTTSWSLSSGTAALVCADLVLTASGSVGPFRYVYLYNDTAAGDPLIGYWDYGSSISLANGETFTVDFGANVLTVA